MCNALLCWSGAVFPAVREEAMPTWWEFVQTLVSSTKVSSWDPHWRPAYLFCSPCTFSYNTILKFENLQQEQVRYRTG